ncbi:hypothetical protein O181_027334, partial [Austropuccinia psidii MF-1]|nr:hypothetical protein [Austropuccinia psidii MF-1]
WNTTSSSFHQQSDAEAAIFVHAKEFQELSSQEPSLPIPPIRVVQQAISDLDHSERMSLLAPALHRPGLVARMPMLVSSVQPKLLILASWSLPKAALNEPCPKQTFADANAHAQSEHGLDRSDWQMTCDPAWLRPWATVWYHGRFPRRSWHAKAPTGLSKRLLPACQSVCADLPRSGAGHSEQEVPIGLISLVLEGAPSLPLLSWRWCSHRCRAIQSCTAAHTPSQTTVCLLKASWLQTCRRFSHCSDTASLGSRRNTLGSHPGIHTPSAFFLRTELSMLSRLSATYDALPTTSHHKKENEVSKVLRITASQRWFKRAVMAVVLTFIFIWLPYYYLESFNLSSRRPRLQPYGPPASALDQKRQNQIRKAFLESYELYTKYAWGHDEVRPSSLGYSDPRNGWGATIVDSVTTLSIMNLTEHVDAAITHIINTDFNQSKIKGQATSVFETTIRYLGGILSIYELTGQSQSTLLHKAEQLGNKLQTAWINQSEIPYAWMYFDSNKPNSQDTITIAEAGSLTLEFNRLSYWTGNDTYRRRAESTSRHIMRNPHIFPGLHAQTLVPQTGLPDGDTVGWGANVDSFLEYGVKYWQLAGEQAADFIDYWQQAVDSSIEHLLRWSPDNKFLYLVEHSEMRGGVQDFMTHLSCFAPGNWMLGGRLLDNDAIFDFGLGLAETCYASYNATATGLGPDRFTPSSNNVFLVHDTNFILRPEVVESVWYAWRLTGDPIWKERAWSIFAALEKYCKVPGGYDGLKDVTNPYAGKHDQTESFLFGEFFKYLYLTFTPREYFSLDEWIFTTEAHPLKLTQFSHFNSNRVRPAYITFQGSHA